MDKGLRAMQLRLENKIIVITGGAKGIGAAIARACAQEGAIPVVIDRDADAGRKIEQELTAEGTKGKWISAELSEPDACRQVVAAIVQQYGRINGLVNNPDSNDPVGLEHATPQEYLESQIGRAS